ncbi:MAG: leucine-rich repeat domain-containing protein [Alistipes sp.]|nr:leucine-rich repeat domain-containing protein [Alistipes sp.]
MKKFLLAMCVAFVAIACTVDDTTPIQPDSLGNDVPTIIHASVDTQIRSELQWEDDAPKSYWSVGDKIAVFNALPNYNAYELDSDEPCHDGDFKLIEGSEIKGAEDGFEFAETVAFYPYADNLTLQSGENESAVLKFVVPATQLFVKSDSYCETSNPMVAVEMTGDYAFKNLFGFLKVTLTGSETIKKIVLKGNNGEILAGDCEANIADYSVAVGNNGSTKLTIDCGEGVELNEEGISFIFALPPTIFEQGFTIEATDTEYRCFTISTTNEVAITRNAIQSTDAIASSEAAVSCIIDAEAMTAEQLRAAVAKALDYEFTAITVNLAEDADEAMFSAIAAALAATVDPSLEFHDLGQHPDIILNKIDLTISGAKTIPDMVFSFSDHDNENWKASAVLNSVTLTDATTIGERSFYSCLNMASFSAPNAITIASNALSTCYSLVEVNLPSVQSVGHKAFNGCDALKTISLPECTSIDSFAFLTCHEIETIYLPKVTTIGAYAFQGCYSQLKTLTLGAVTSVDHSNFGIFHNHAVDNIDLVLSSEQKVMTYDSGTAYWTATEADYNGSEDHNNKSFVGYTFKSVTFH